MNHLPNELLPLIIQQVTKPDWISCSHVNRAFYTATLPFLWRTYSESNHGNPDELLSRLENTHHPLAKHVRNLELGSGWDDSTLLLLAPHLHLLELLMIRSGQHLTAVSLGSLPRHCPNLKTLRLSLVYLYPPFMTALGEHCRHLEELDLCYCADMSLGGGLFTPLVRCPLKKVWILGAFAANDWKNATLKQMARLPHLNRLSFETGKRYMNQRLVEAATLPGWPRLTHLEIGYLGDLEDDSLIPLIQTRCRLQSLSLCRGEHITDATLDAIGRYLPGLTTLNVRGTRMTTAGLRRLVRRCPQLRYVALPCSVEVRDAFPEVTRDMSHVPDLHHADLNNIRCGGDPVT